MAYYIGSILAVESDIKHYGRLGMKWYQHIFTNPDGSPKSDKEINDNVNTVNKTFQSASSSTRSAAGIVERHSKKAKPSDKVAKELYQMNDDELRKRVNRMNLERQYRELTGDDVRKGSQSAMTIIRDIGDLIGVVGGIAGLGMMILKLRRGAI